MTATQNYWEPIPDNWPGAYWVTAGIESPDGGSGWDTDYYGPFFTAAEAHAVVRRIATRECANRRPIPGKARAVIELWESSDSDVNEDGQPESLKQALRGKTRWVYAEP